MTEDDAKMKWCPFARVDSTASNRADHVGFQYSRDPCCIASACMAWRGEESAEFQRRAEAAFRREGARLTPTGADIDGHCGLAGFPA